MNPKRRGLVRAAAIAAGAVALGRRLRAAPSELQILRPRIDPLPPVPLTTMLGQPRRLDTELANTTPLVMNFVFTTCSSSCSVQTALLVQVQRELAARQRAVQIASLTIDPDNDTPEQLQRFSHGFGIGTGQGWQFYTGRFDDLMRVQCHFDVYRGSKAAHPPVLMLRREARAPWLRVEGFPTSGELLELIGRLPAAS